MNLIWIFFLARLGGLIKGIGTLLQETAQQLHRGPDSNLASKIDGLFPEKKSERGETNPRG